MAARGTCTGCAQDRALTDLNKVRKHGDCPGGGLAPHCAEGRCTGCCGCSQECTDEPCGAAPFNAAHGDVATAGDGSWQAAHDVVAQALEDAKPVVLVGGHVYLDSTGVLWHHPGLKDDCATPECCERCNTDMHVCPGCGEPVPHGTVACAECDPPESGTLIVRPSSSPEVLDKAVKILEKQVSAADQFLMGKRPTGGEADADAFLMGEDDRPNDGMNCLVRGGRYRLPDQITGAPKSWTRATTLAETISDLYAINLYKLQMATIGFANNLGLLKEFAGVTREERGTYKEELNTAHWRAAKLAGDKVPANWGTRMHLWIERLSRDEITLADVEPAYRDEVTAYAAAMADNGLSAVPDLIERRIAVPIYGVAGTLDQVVQIHRSVSIRINNKIFRLNAGDYLIGDIKSGRDLSYAEKEISRQLAIYAHGVRQGLVARWDPDADPVREDDGGAWVWEKISIPPKALRTDVGVVMHVPIGQKKCTLNWINIERGWEALQLCEAVRDDRREKGLLVPFSVAEVPTEAAPPVVRNARWSERFKAVTSKAAASDLYKEYKASPDFSADKAARLVKIAKASIAAVAESSA